MKTFADFGLSPRMLNSLSVKGLERPTPIQEKVIPFILSTQKDLIAQAQTGTGKTAAFGIPIIELLKENEKHVQTLVLTPTRELAVQVSEEIYSLKGDKKIRILPIYGGQSMSQQLERLKKGVDIVVGTPGRILDHIKRKTLILDKVSYLVLDEADEMLNMGFFEDVTEIMRKTPPHRRTLLFSATMPPAIREIANKHMGESEMIKSTQENLTVSSIDQIYFEVPENNKFEALCRIIDVEEVFYGLIFCRTKTDTDHIAKHLVERGYEADALHGDIPQVQREKILNKFKKRVINILVATDVAARGIDVHDLTHVINYALPQDPEAYVHRIGRTGRAGKEGNAITFITPSEYKKLKNIQRLIKTDIRKAKLPNVKDIIAAKRLRIKASIEEAINLNPSEECYAMAVELMQQQDASDIIAALLQYTFQDALTEQNYASIEQSDVDTKGKTRLFISQGKKEGLTPKKLLSFIEKKCGVPESAIKDIQILDKFSFLTLPFHEAETVLSFFKRRKEKDNLYITKAKSPGGKRD